MFRYLALPVVLIGLLTTACQTSMLSQFESIKPGMEKDDVLDIMGSPSQTQRFHGKDRWYYIFYDNRIRFEKEVQFFEGNAVYIGDTMQPEPSRTAFAVDVENEKKNHELDMEVAKDIEKNRRAYEVYESQTKGTDKVRYLPTFEPIR